MTTRQKALNAYFLLVCLALAPWVQATVEGRYITYGNPLSPAMALAEFEVWSGGQNVVAKKPELFTQDYLYSNVSPSKLYMLTDGKKDTSKRYLEFKGGGISTYSDTASSYPAIEVDLGTSMPIDRIGIYRSWHPRKGYKDGGWRYLLVLDEQRRIVAWETFNVYEKPYPDNQGIWQIEPKPASGAPAGRVVPFRNRSWLSEAEFLRDFLGRPVVDQVTDLTPADRERLQRFEQRNSPEAIEALGKEFFRIVELDRPGLETVKALVERQEYAAALEAFKAPFFQTISILAGNDGFEYSWGYDPDSRDTMRVRDLSNHVFGNIDSLTVTRFRPGLMPPAKFKYPFQMRPLLVAYSGTGDPKLLKEWEAMTDDWAMSFQDAADRDPALREHFVLIGGEVKRNLQDLAQAAADRPEFVEDLSGATLARFMMPIVEEMPVAIWRVWRTCVFNHNFHAVGGSWELAKLLADFKAGTRFEREYRQQTLRLHTLAQYRDGPMVEAVDEGHFPPTRALSWVYGDMIVDRPAWFTPMREAFLLDQLRETELVAVRHTSPNGVGIRWSPRRGGNYDGFNDRLHPELAALRAGKPVSEDTLCAFLQCASVMQESEVQSVVDTVYGWGALRHKVDAKETRKLVDQEIVDRYRPTPSVRSDWLPYAGCYYFRGGWERDASFLHMLSPATLNASSGGSYQPIYKAWERFGPTSYRFQDYATLLLSTFPTQIDGQLPCPQFGRYPSGSKQSNFTQATEKPQPMRWYAGDTLDFGEAVFAGKYHNIYKVKRKDENGTWGMAYDHDPLQIDDVTTTRQIIQVLPARLFLQIERVAYSNAEETHTNRIPSTVVLTEPSPESGKAFSNDQLVLDQEKKIIKARNPGNPGVTMAWCGQPDLSFIPYTVQGTDTMFWPHPLEVKVDPAKDAKLNLDSWGNGAQSLDGLRATSARGVMTSWSAQGQSVLIGALYANEPDKESVRQTSDLSNNVWAGIRIDSTSGARTTLLVARAIPATLTIDDLTVEGEALLVSADRHKGTTVMVLGARALSHDGEHVALPSPDAVFRLKEGAVTDIQAIHRPLDPPTVGPEVNTFTGTTTVTLSTTSPDAVIRYTTEVPASRMDDFQREARRLAAGESTISQSAERLALRDLEGAEWKTYTGPFTIAKDTLVRARTFRQGINRVPMLEIAGDDVSVISYGFFHKRELVPSRGGFFTRTTPGLAYEYLEGRWFALWSYADVLPAKATGTTESLLDVSMRQTDGPFAVRYRGMIDIPESGVYTFYGPDEYINNIAATGYDLRVFVDGEEWDLGQTWHGRGTWSIPLEKGLHDFCVTFADARAKDTDNQRIDLWGRYPVPATTWKGTAPVLEISGPDLPRQPLPQAWLKRRR